MYRRQLLPADFERGFDGCYHFVALSQHDRFEINSPIPRAWLRLRLGCAEMPHLPAISVNGPNVAGGSVRINVRPGWHSYYVPLTNEGASHIEFVAEGLETSSAKKPREARPGIGVSLVSIAATDIAWRDRELAEVDSRASIFAETEAAHAAAETAPAVATAGQSSNYLDGIRESWDLFGRTDPLYYILTDPRKKGNRWEPDEFFQTGRAEIDRALDSAESFDVPVMRRRALDFGCGVGRLAQALARQFDEVHGVDIAQSMVAGANRMNLYPDRVTYHVNDQQHLRLFPDNSFDFIYTGMVLQHIRPQVAREYLKEFMRILAPGGVLLFQLPSRLLRTRYGLLLSLMPERMRMWYLQRISFLPAAMEFHWIPRRRVERFLRQIGGQVRGVLDDHSTAGAAISFSYCVSKPGQPAGAHLPSVLPRRVDAQHSPTSNRAPGAPRVDSTVSSQRC